MTQKTRENRAEVNTKKKMFPNHLQDKQTTPSLMNGKVRGQELGQEMEERQGKGKDVILTEYTWSPQLTTRRSRDRNRLRCAWELPVLQSAKQDGCCDVVTTSEVGFWKALYKIPAKSFRWELLNTRLI